MKSVRGAHLEATAAEEGNIVSNLIYIFFNACAPFLNAKLIRGTVWGTVGALSGHCRGTVGALQKPAGINQRTYIARGVVCIAVRVCSGTAGRQADG